jgi:hemoglobin
MRHVRFAIGSAARDRWLGLMHAALDEAQLPAEAVVVLLAFFDATSTFLINQ